MRQDPDSVIGASGSRGITSARSGAKAMSDIARPAHLTDDGEKYTYTYNPWGQLVEVKDRLTPFNLRARYTYNGMGMRISEQLDTNRSANDGIADGVVNGDDPVFYVATDMSGRRVATYRGTDADPKERFVHHAAGQRGPMVSGGPIYRDRDSSLSDPTKWAVETGGGGIGERYYYCANHRGQIIALITHDGKLAEQYRYSPTGVPFGIPLGDVNGDGKVQAGITPAPSTDLDIIKSVGGGTYQPRADLTLDGVVDKADETVAAANDGMALGRGRISSPQVAAAGFESPEFDTRRSILFPPVTMSCLDAVPGWRCTPRDSLLDPWWWDSPIIYCPPGLEMPEPSLVPSAPSDICLRPDGTPRLLPSFPLAPFDVRRPDDGTRGRTSWLWLCCRPDQVSIGWLTHCELKVACDAADTRGRHAVYIDTLTKGRTTADGIPCSTVTLTELQACRRKWYSDTHQHTPLRHYDLNNNCQTAAWLGLGACCLTADGWIPTIGWRLLPTKICRRWGFTTHVYPDRAFRTWGCLEWYTLPDPDSINCPGMGQPPVPYPGLF